MEHGSARSEWSDSQGHLAEVVALAARHLTAQLEALQKHSQREMKKLLKLAAYLKGVPGLVEAQLPGEGPSPESQAVERLARSCFVKTLHALASSERTDWDEAAIASLVDGVRKDEAFAQRLGWDARDVSLGVAAVGRVLLDQQAFSAERAFLVDDRVISLMRTPVGLRVQRRARLMDDDDWLPT